LFICTLVYLGGASQAMSLRTTLRATAAEFGVQPVRGSH
jgi:hypothetical protein